MGHSTHFFPLLHCVCSYVQRVQPNLSVLYQHFRMTISLDTHTFHTIEYTTITYKVGIIKGKRGLYTLVRPGIGDTKQGTVDRIRGILYSLLLIDTVSPQFWLR